MFSETGAVCAVAATAAEAQGAAVIQTLMLVLSGFYRSHGHAAGFMEHVSRKTRTQSAVCWRWLLSFLPGLATSPSLPPALPFILKR